MQLILSRLLSRHAAAFVLGGVLVALLRKACEAWERLKRNEAEFLWRRHVDFSVVQACVLSTEHLESLGRIEKRTLFVKPITEVFRNEYILARVLEAAEKAANSKDPMLMTQLTAEDKWHVLNTCTNHISSLFAPYHVFFNEARRTKSHYRSAWYCFTLTCAQTEAEGRWFITPFKPVGAGDCGSLRIRIVLVNEQELRDIAAGEVEAPISGLFNGRHDSRWRICQRFADLFGRQLRQVAGSSGHQQDWGRNLCGRFSDKKKQSENRLSDLALRPAAEPEPEDNALLRIHIPFPSVGPSSEAQDPGGSDQAENVSRDVVLFE